MPKIPQTIFNLTIGILLVNVIGLWTVQIVGPQLRPTPPINTPALSTQNTAPTTASTTATADQLTAFRQELSNLSSQVATLQGQTNVTTVKSTASTSSVKEFVIYLGNGSTNQRDWTELEGTRTTIDTSNYPGIKTVTFEAALGIIGGEAHARLINKTTGAVLAQTEVSHNTQTTVWKISSPLTLHTGRNEYAVQLRSTSGELAKLEGARLRITVR